MPRLHTVAAGTAALVLVGLGVTAATALTEATVASPACEQSVSEALLASRIVGTAQSYRKDNPTEYALVRAYLDGGSRPSTSGMTHMGLHLVYLEDTCRGATTSTTTTTATTTTTTATPPPSDPISPNDCSVDVTSKIQSWIDSSPNGTTFSFDTNACYRVDGTIEFNFRSGLTFVGNGTTFRSLKPMVSGVYEDGQRAMWRAVASSTITWRNMTIDGAYTRGGTHDETLQWAHGIDLRGTSADISTVTITDVAGDCVYFGLNYWDNLGRSSGTFKDSTCLRTGRQAVSVVAANDVLVQRVTTDVIGFIAFDVEPDSGGGNGTARITFDSNTIGSYYLYAYGIVTAPGATNVDQTFTANRATSAKGLKIGIVDPGNTGMRHQRVTISGNSSVSSTPSPAIEAHNVDTLTVTNNNVSTGTLLACTSVTGLTFSGNTPNTKSGCP